MATTKKSPTKRVAAKKSPPTKRAAVKKPAKATKKPTIQPSREEPAPTPEESPQYGLIYYLRGASRHWPKRIGKFIHHRKLDKWIYGGKPIPIEEWQKRAEAITEEVRQETDGMLWPVVTIVEMDEPEQTEDPTWKKNLAKASKAMKPIDPAPTVEQTPEAPITSDEQPATKEPPTTETLY